MRARSIFLLAIMFVPGICWANSIADVVWIDSSDQTFKVLSSSLVDDDWTEAELIYQSELPLSSPTIMRDQAGTRISIWSERRRKKSVLLQASRSLSALKWREPILFSDYGKENLNPSIVVDDAQQLWVFWSANHGDLDDIYYVTSRGGSWTEEARAHPANEVPDFKPVASLNADGSIRLQWQRFDIDLGAYTTTERIIEINYETLVLKPQNKQSDEELVAADIELPDFVPTDSASVIYFPGNRLNQSERLD